MRKKHRPSRDNALIRPQLVALLESASIFGGETHLQVTPSVGLSVCLSVCRHFTHYLFWETTNPFNERGGGVTLFFFFL